MAVSVVFIVIHFLIIIIDILNHLIKYTGDQSKISLLPSKALSLNERHGINVVICIFF